MYFTLPPLPFKPSQVFGWLSAETLNFHHGRHHRAYVEKLNHLIEGSGLERASLEEIVKKSSGPLYNNAAQAWNHTFYWEGISSNAHNSALEGFSELAKYINLSFGSLVQFEAQFMKSASEVFGSGWVWLTKDAGSSKLRIIQTQNADNPIRSGLVPLLVCDVWEHAYYIDYRNARAQYVDGFLKAVNWNKVAEIFTRGIVCDLTSKMRPLMNERVAL